MEEETLADSNQHPMICPYCGTKIIVFSPMEKILAARRTCPKCKKEFFIENGTPSPL
jgi:DNA-directed RNA polymerase subunit RPC12/RpoP